MTVRPKLVIVTVYFSCCILAYSQGEETKKVSDAVESLRRAMVDGDKATLTNLTTPELSYGHSSGTIEDQNAFVDAIVSGKNDFKTLELSEQKISLVGKELAIVRHKFKAEISLLNGTTINPDIGVLQVWQKRKGKWLLLARQAFKP